MSTELKQRLPFLDMAKTIGVILVILGHCGSFPTHGILHRIPTFIYSFHMPLFFIISGYLLKPMDIRQATAKYFKAYLKPGLLILVLKLVLFFTIPLCWNIATDKANAYQITLINDIYFGPIWFFFGLFWALLLYQAIVHLYTDWNRFPIIIALFILSVFSGHFFRLPFCIQSGMFALPFIEVGRFLRKINFPRDTYSINRTSIIIISLIFLFSAGKGGLDISTLHYTPNHLNIMGAIIGSCSLLFTVNKFNIGGGRWIGKNSLSILCTHTLILFITNYYWSFAHNLHYPAILNLIIEFSTNFFLSLLLAVIFKHTLLKWIQN